MSYKLFVYQGSAVVKREFRSMISRFTIIKMEICFSGDVVGTGFFTTPLLIKKIIPNGLSGVGELYLFEFAMNLFWLQFLKETEQLGQANVGKILTGLIKRTWYLEVYN